MQKQKQEAPILRRAAPLAAHSPLRCTARGGCCWSIKWTPSWFPFRPDAGASIALALRGIVRSALLPYAGAAVPAILPMGVPTDLAQQSAGHQLPLRKNLNRWAGIQRWTGPRVGEGGGPTRLLVAMPCCLGSGLTLTIARIGLQIKYGKLTEIFPIYL